MGTTHDLLYKVLANQKAADVDRGWIRKTLSNHLTQHWKLTLGAWTAALAAIVGLILLLIERFANG